MSHDDVREVPVSIPHAFEPIRTSLTPSIARPGARRAALHRVRPDLDANVGHHLSIPTDDGPIGIFDGVLEPWEHLTSCPEQIYARLEPRLGAKTAQRVIEYVFSYPDLNHLPEADHMSLLHDSG